MSHDTQRLLEQAEHNLEIGQIDGAIETLRRALSEDPDIAEAHALLALGLLRKRRAYAAEVEAKLALTLAPEQPLAHAANAEVAHARRDFKAAERHIEALLAAMPDVAAFHRLKARHLVLTGRGAERRAVLEEALEKDPNDPTTLAELAEYHAEVGDWPQALHYAELALRMSPESQEALVAMGNVLLTRGDVAGAREHALHALRADPNDPAALRLMTSIKTRSNPLLGIWWRYAVWSERVGPTRNVVVLLGAFVVYRIAVIAADDAGAAALASGIQIAWLALVLYSFVGPVLFRRALRRELESVTLRRF